MANKADRIKYRHPPAPPGFDNENSTVVYFYKPETNPIVRMVAAERAAQSGIQDVIELLDQFLLETPPVSEDDEISVVEPGEIVSPAKQNLKEQVAEEPFQMLIAIEKDKKVLKNSVTIMETQDKSVKEDKTKKQSKHSRTKDKTLSIQKKSHKSLAEESLSSDDSNSSSSTLDKKDVEKSVAKKKKQDNTGKEDKTKKQSKHSRIKNKTLSNQKKSISSDDSSSSSPSFSKAFRLTRSESSPIRSLKCHKSPTVVGRKRRRSPNLSYVPNRCRSASRSRSPEIELSDGRRSGRNFPGYLSPTHRSRTHRRHKYSSPQWSPKRSSRSPSLKRRSSKRRSSSRRSRDYSPNRRSSRRRSPRRDSSFHRSSSNSPVDRSYRHRSPSNSPDGRSYRRRSPSRSSSRTRNRHRRESPKHYGSVSPDRIRAQKSPIRDRVPLKKSLVHSSYEGRSGSSSQSSKDERHIEKEKDNSKNSPKTAAPKPKIIRLVGTSRFSKITKLPADDEYSQTLAEEMKKRQLIKDSAEASGSGQKPTTVETSGVPLEKETVSEEVNAPLQQDQANLVKKESDIVNPNQMQLDAGVPKPKLIKKENIKSEFPEQKGSLLNSYYCQACQLGLNSELTWQSHISGKKHAKMLKLQTVHEIAKGSIAIPSTPAVVSEDIPRFAEAPAGKRRYRVGDVARLQPAIDDVRDLPMSGLDSIQEIISEMDVNYYCELCDSPCGPSSIMPHLIGYKHQLRCLREISPDYYEQNKFRSKKSFERQVIDRLFNYENKYGRGRIKVFMEKDDPTTRPIYDLPGVSWRNTSSIPDIKKEKTEDGETEIPMNDECLDTSKGDFFCKLCDSHMNNVKMWEAHVRGKRHLKNAKKIPGDNISKLKSVKVPGARSKLEDLIHTTARDELIVGLDFLRETQGINGEIYNCFLCGSCSTNFDIIEHLLLAKHRLRYLEKLVTEGKPNSVTSITQMEFTNPWYREQLVNQECERMVEMYGSGKVEVYLTKN